MSVGLEIFDENGNVVYDNRGLLTQGLIANAITTTAFTQFSSGGQLSNFTQNVWQDFNTTVGGGSSSGGGGGSGGGSGGNIP